MTLEIIKKDFEAISDCFNSNYISGKTEIEVSNKLGVPVKVQIGAACDCHPNNFGQQECGYNYEFDNPIHENNNHIIENLVNKETITLEGKDWTKLQFRVKKGNRWTEYHDISNNKIMDFELPTGNPLLITFVNNLEVKKYKYLDNKRTKKIFFNV